MPILLLTSLLANLAMLKRYNADISVGQIAVWAFVFMVASPPSFLTIFNQFRSKLWLYRAFETIVMILLVATLGESPMKRIWDNLFFANVLLACLATMAIASFLENWLPSKPSTSGYKEILSAEEGLVPDESPLIAAIQEDDIIMAGLLGKLSDLNVPNAKDEIPLYFAESTAMVEVLIEAGTNPKSDHASHFLTESLKKSDDKEMPKELLEIGVQMDAEGKRVVLGKLCDAAKRNSFDAVSWLVTALPDEALLDEILLEKIIWSLRKVSADGTILHASHLLTACLQRNDYDDLAEKLLDLGVKSDLEGKRLALVKFCEAVKRDELERVKWFGRFEPDLNTATEDGVLPAEWVKSMAVLDYLQDHKCNVAIIGEATILEAPSEVIRKMLSVGGFVSNSKSSQRAVMHKLLAALKEKDLEHVEAYLGLVQYVMDEDVEDLHLCLASLLAKSDETMFSTVVKKIAGILSCNAVKCIFKGNVIQKVSDVCDANILLTLANHGLDLSQDLPEHFVDSIATKQRQLGFYGSFMVADDKQTKWEDLRIPVSESAFFQDEDMKNLITAIPALAQEVSLNVMGSDRLSENGLDCFRELREAHLRKLTVLVNDGRGLSNDALQVLSSAIPLAVEMLLLQFSNSQKFTDEGLKGLAARLPQSASTISLNFYSNKNFTDEGLKGLAARLPQSATTISLNFFNNENFTDEGLKGLAARLPQSATTISLVFSGIDFRNEGLKGLAARLPQSATTIRLSFLNNNRFTDDGLKGLAARLPQSATTISLAFTLHTDFTDEGLTGLAARVPQNATTIILHFSNNEDFTDEGLKGLAASLPQSATTISLDFEDNKNFTDEGLKGLAASLPQSATTISLVFFRNNNFTDDGLKGLAARLPQSATTISLDFGCNENFTDEGLKGLAARVPQSATTISLAFICNKNFTDEGLKGLAARLPQSATYISLNFRARHFSDNDLSELFAQDQQQEEQQARCGCLHSK